MSFHTDIDRTETKFSHIYFIPEGTTVDAVTVAQNTWPDADPATNYSAYKFKELEMVKTERSTDSETRLYVSETTGKYEEENDTNLKAKSYLADTSKTNAFVKMLEYGLASLPVPGTPQVPRADARTYRDGVMLKETGIVATGEITERLHTWARVELVTEGDESNKTSKIQLRFTEKDSDNNTFELVSPA